jgi:hypothetical protein
LGNLIGSPANRCEVRQHFFLEKFGFGLKILKITGSVLLIIFYVENLDVGSWGVKNDV